MHLVDLSVHDFALLAHLFKFDVLGEVVVVLLGYFVFTVGEASVTEVGFLVEVYDKLVLSFDHVELAFFLFEIDLDLLLIADLALAALLAQPFYFIFEVSNLQLTLMFNLVVASDRLLFVFTVFFIAVDHGLKREVLVV